MNRFLDLYLTSVPARGRRIAGGTDRTIHQRRALHAARVASNAAANARLATHRLLGAHTAARSTWHGRPDGTATGVVDGLPFTWDPRREGTPLRLLRRCARCGSTWSAPASSDGQVIRALVEDRCGCPHAPHHGDEHDAVGP